MKSFVNRPLRVILATNILVLVAAGMLAPIYAVFVERIGGDLLDAGIAAALFAVAAGFTTLIAGRFSDRAKHKEFIVAASYLLTGVGFLLYLWVGTVWQLFALQVAIGLVQASYTPAFDGLYTAFIGSRKQASSRWSLWEASNYFSIAIGAFLGAAVVTFWGFDALFIFMATLCFAAGGYVFLVRRKVFA